MSMNKKYIFFDPETILYNNIYDAILVQFNSV